MTIFSEALLNSKLLYLSPAMSSLLEQCTFWLAQSLNFKKINVYKSKLHTISSIIFDLFYWSKLLKNVYKKYKDTRTLKLINRHKTSNYISYKRAHRRTFLEGLWSSHIILTNFYWSSIILQAKRERGKQRKSILLRLAHFVVDT